MPWNVGLSFLLNFSSRIQIKIIMSMCFLFFKLHLVMFHVTLEVSPTWKKLTIICRWTWAQHCVWLLGSCRCFQLTCICVAVWWTWALCVLCSRFPPGCFTAWVKQHGKWCSVCWPRKSLSSEFSAMLQVNKRTLDIRSSWYCSQVFNYNLSMSSYFQWQVKYLS